MFRGRTTQCVPFCQKTRVSSQASTPELKNWNIFFIGIFMPCNQPRTITAAVIDTRQGVTRMLEWLLGTRYIEALQAGLRRWQLQIPESRLARSRPTG